jgi:hypothetical protein
VAIRLWRTDALPLGLTSRRVAGLLALLDGVQPCTRPWRDSLTRFALWLTLVAYRVVRLVARRYWAALGKPLVIRPGD